MAESSPIRTVIATDFDNDGVQEVFYNNIVYSGGSSPETWKNRLFRVTPAGADVTISKLDVGDALEPDGYGTGNAEDLKSIDLIALRVSGRLFCDTYCIKTAIALVKFDA